MWGAALVALVGAGFDLATRRIPNWWTLPSLIVGLLASGYLFSWAGFGSSLAGVAIAFLLYIPLFALGFMGAGDVKLLMAVCAWMGARDAIGIAVTAILVGGGFALFDTMRRRRLGVIVRELLRVFRELFYLQKVLSPLALDQKASFSFGVAIALALPVTLWWGGRL